MPRTGKTIRIWMGVRRPAILIPWGVGLGLTLVAIAASPGMALRWVMIFLGILLVSELLALLVRLEITASTVRAWQSPAAPKEAPRSGIRAIHYLPYEIGFEGVDGQPVMTITPQWTLRQMTRVANELDVPLYDHKGMLGLEELAAGRLVNPAEWRPPPPSGGHWVSQSES